MLIAPIFKHYVFLMSFNDGLSYGAQSVMVNRDGFFCFCLKLLRSRKMENLAPPMTQVQAVQLHILQ